MKRGIVFFVGLSFALMLAGSPAFAQYGIFDNAVDWYSPDNPRGNTKIAGELYVDDGEYDILGNGDDIWNNDDEGFFVYSEKPGSWRLSARVFWLFPGGNEWAKIGVMIREKPDNVSSRFYWISLRGQDNGDQVHTQWRPVESAGCSSSQAYEDPPDNTVVVQATGDGVWLRVTRIADINLFLTEYSYDGAEWFTAHSATLEGWADTVAYGLAVTNHDDNDVLAEALVDNVVLEETPAIVNITRSLNAKTFEPGQQVNAVLDLFYTGSAAKDTTITETLPPGFTASEISDGGTESGGIITWSLSLPPGPSQLSYTATAAVDYDPSSIGYAAVWNGEEETAPEEKPNPIGGASTIYYYHNIAVGDEIFSFDFSDAAQADEWEDWAGTWGVENGTFVEYDDADGPLVSVTGDPGLTDIAITVDAMGLVGDADWGLVFRATDIGNFYSWQFCNGGLYYLMYSGGSRTEPFTPDYPEVLNEWQKFQVILKGNVFYLLFNDEIQGVIEDDTHAAGQVGFFGWINSGSDIGDAGGIAYDNFVVSEVVESTDIDQWPLY
ncbi:MAG: hypothetical protein JXR73_11955 [Candidatus Omnitrophica bacterium]|nr:hypothetical protein [Candidatus Omnitrophota bacterium]